MAVSRPRLAVLVRSLLLAIAVAAFAAAGAQLARGAEGDPPAAASVTIAPSGGGTPRTLALADLAAQQDVHGATYTLRAADGATSTLTVANGISLDALLRAAGLDADAFTYVEVARPDGSSAFVVRDQFGVAEEGPPVVWSDEQGVHFLRPSTGDDDPNAADHVVLPAGAALSVALRTGDPIAARISASALRARPNEAIDFSATLVAGALGPGMTFEWYFDDSRSASGASVTHRFRRAGRYTVLLNIMRGAQAVGPPAIVVVRIEQPAREREGDGARRSGEQRRDDGARAGTGSGGDGAGDGTGSGSGAGGSGTGAPVAPAYTPAPAPVAPTPVPEPTPPPARRAAPRAPEPQGELVSGTLLAAASGPPPAPGGDDGPSATARDDAPADPLDVPVGVWIAIGLGAIVALGWTLESRHTLPFWQP